MDAQAAGELDANEDPAQLAFEVVAYLLFGNTGFVLRDDPAPLRLARTAVEARLARARPGRRTHAGKK
ncbi:MAG: TetR family transcriptional regulator C-terminal domain-containing protein [Gaiellaceae bacterium]